MRLIVVVEKRLLVLERERLGNWGMEGHDGCSFLSKGSENTRNVCVCVCVWYVYTKRKIVIHHRRHNVDNGSIWVPLCSS